MSETPFEVPFSARRRRVSADPQDRRRWFRRRLRGRTRRQTVSPQSSSATSSSTSSTRALPPRGEGVSQLETSPRAIRRLGRGRRRRREPHWLAMELLDGRTLRAELEASGGRPAGRPGTRDRPPGRSRARGVLHEGRRTSRLQARATSTGSRRHRTLLDFGVVSLLDTTTITLAAAFPARSRTPLPEQLRSEAASPSICTPWASSSTRCSPAVAHTAATPPPIRGDSDRGAGAGAGHNPSSPRDLDELVMSLLDEGAHGQARLGDANRRRAAASDRWSPSRPPYPPLSARRVDRASTHAWASATPRVHPGVPARVRPERRRRRRDGEARDRGGPPRHERDGRWTSSSTRSCRG